jgi:hypothetical protein
MKKEMIITFVDSKNSAILDYNNFPKMFLTGDIIQGKDFKSYLVKEVSIDLLNNKIFIRVEQQ